MRFSCLAGSWNLRKLFNWTFDIWFSLLKRRFNVFRMYLIWLFKWRMDGNCLFINYHIILICIKLIQGISITITAATALFTFTSTTTLTISTFNSNILILRIILGCPIKRYIRSFNIFLPHNLRLFLSIFPLIACIVCCCSIKSRSGLYWLKCWERFWEIFLNKFSSELRVVLRMAHKCSTILMLKDTSVSMPISSS